MNLSLLLDFLKPNKDHINTIVITNPRVVLE